jgi:hypothetical protein
MKKSLYYLLLALLALGVVSLRAQTDPVADRAYLVGILTKTADPLLQAVVAGEINQRLPRREWEEGRRLASYAEGLCRSIAAMAPWLALPPDDTPEGQLRARYADLARRALVVATDPQHKDYRVFIMWGRQKTKGPDGVETTVEGPNRQFLVEAAYIAHAMLRAPGVFWEPLTPEQRANLVATLKLTRPLEPVDNNWTLFPTMVEAALWKFTGEMDQSRFKPGITKHLAWYVGDGVYGDGKPFHWDYYNSYSIQPMLLDGLRIAKEMNHPLGREYDRALRRAARYAEVLERLVSPEGTFPLIGRSSTYRMAAFQVLAQMLLWDKLNADVNPAAARDAISAVTRRMMDAPGTFDAQGWIDIGAVGRQPSMRDPYNGTGGLMLALSGLLHLGLPANHPVWTAAPAPWTQKRLWAGEDLPRDTALPE